MISSSRVPRVRHALGVIVGLLFFRYELLKNRLRESIDRLKERELAERELETARKIQRRILGPTSVEGPGYRVAAENRPALYVAGDFYDVFTRAEGTLDLVAADVSGKGMAASLVMASVKGRLPLLAETRGVAETLVESFCEQILTRGYFHADPHPGNLLVQPEGPRLVLLDFGLAKDLPAHFRQGVLDFVGALLQGKTDLMAHALAELGFETRDGQEESLRDTYLGAEAALSAATADIDGELERIEERLGGLRSDVDKKVLRRFDRLRQQHLVAASTLAGSRCEGCHLDLSAAEVDSVKDAAAAAGGVSECPQCGRLLVI